MKGKDFFSRKSKSDFFETPYSMTEQLLRNEKFDKKNIILEPAYGKGAITKILYRDSYNYMCYDLNSNHPQDFLKQSIKFDYIITNPPFSLWDEFVKKAKQIAKIKFAFLGRLEFLTGIKRFNDQLYQDPEYPLTKIYLFVRKINLEFTIPEKEKKYNLIPYRELRQDGKYPAGMFHYAWFVFEKQKIKGWEDKAHNKIDINQVPRIKWIDNNKYILRKKD